MTVTSPSAGGATVREIAADLMTRGRWTPDRLAAHQRERLGELVRYAAAHSPYYRRVLRDVPGDVPLHELPTLTKTTLMEHFDEIVTDERLRLDTASSRLTGPDAGRLPSGHRVFATAGSTGERGVFVYAEAEFTVWVAAFLRGIATMGVTPGMRAASIGAPSPIHLSRQVFAEVAGDRTGEVPELYVSTPVPQMLAPLDAYRPDAISTLPSIAALLAEEQLAGRLHIAPSLVATGAEVLTEDMRRRIRDAWGIEPQQAYLATEAPVLASTCPEQVGLHLWEDLLLVEVVDAAGRPVEPGVPGHKVLVTNLVNRAQPLIRYELSDSVTLAEGPNPTGRPFRRLSAISGRSADTITLPASAGGTVAVHPIRLRAPFAASPEVVQYQITYDGGGLTVHVVLRAGAAAGTPDRIRLELIRGLHDAGAVPPPITVTAVPSIARDGGHADKFTQIRGVHAATG